MNFAYEMRAYYNRLRRKAYKPSPQEQAFWYYLFLTNNRLALQARDGRYYWPVEFCIPNSELMTLLKVDKKQLWNLRRNLVEDGLVTYDKGGGGQAGIYRLIPFMTGNSEYFIREKESGKKRRVWLAEDTPFTPETERSGTTIQ